jgi:aryl-alcohol dehydrogenase-like predicted oxidoreductase
LEETIRAANKLIEDDKVFYWGTSEFNIQEIMEIHRLCEKYGYVAPAVEQCEYNLLVRQKVEVDYANLFDYYGLGTTVWSPLAGGILSGKYNDGNLHESGSRYTTTAGPRQAT